MALNARFDWSTRQRIQLAAKRFGLTTSGIIRFAVKQQLAAIESGVIHLTNQPGFAHQAPPEHFAQARGATPGRPEPAGVKQT